VELHARVLRHGGIIAVEDEKASEGNLDSLNALFTLQKVALSNSE